MFPLGIAASGRYLEDSAGVPFPILGRAAWFAIAAARSVWPPFFADCVAKGFNACELQLIAHDRTTFGAPTTPFAGDGTLPFKNRLDGGTWTGSISYGVATREAPDFTTPNDAYWANVDAWLASCLANGMLVMAFPSYAGYAFGASGDGWMVEMVANGPARMQAFGAWIASRYRNQPNLVWLLGGDSGTGGFPFNADQQNAEQALIDGIKSVPGAPGLFTAQWADPSVATDQGTFGRHINVNGAYSHSGLVSQMRRAYAAAVLPSFLLEEPYDQSGPDGQNYNAAATQPTRRFLWWGWLSTIGGYMSGNPYVWQFNSLGYDYTQYLNVAGARDLARLNAFVRSIPWYRLVPSGLGSIGTLVTAGGGAIDATSYVAAAATPLGDLLVAYLGPGNPGRVTIDMTKLRGTATARWFDPTNAAYTEIGTYENSGFRVYTTPGNNSAGAGDWVLRLDA